MNLVSSQFDKQDKSIVALTARNQVLNKEIDTQKEKILTLEKAMQNASDSFGESDKRTKAWVVQLNNAKAELNGMERELKGNNNALEKTADEFNNAENESEQFNKALKKTADTADKSDGSFSKLGGALGKISVGFAAGVAAIGVAAVSAGKSLVNMTISASEYADEILTQSTITGMSTESLQAYKYAAELIDTPLETVTATMSKNVKSMASARDGSKTTAEAYKKLGISVTDAHGNLKDGDSVYWQAIDALGKISNETERDALAMQIFGKSARELNPLIAQGSAGMAKLTDEAKRMGAVMSEETIEKLGKFDDSVQRLKQGSEAAKRVMGTVLLPQLQELADEGTTLLGEFTKGLVDAGGDFNKISEVIGNTVGGLADMVMSNLPKLIQVGMKIVSAIGKAIVNNLPMIIDSAVSIVMTLLQGLISALPQITEGALQLIVALCDGIIENLPALIEAAINMVLTLALGIADALPELIPSIIEAIILIVEVLLNNMDKILAAAFAIIEGLAQGLLNALPKLIEALPQIITTIINFITNNLPLIIEMGIQLTLQLAVGLIKAIPQLVASIPQIIGAVLSGFGSAILSVTEIGKNIVSGLWEGIKSMGTWIADNVSGFFGGIVDGVKDLLGIHSPSTVFAGIGENMGAGIGVGFTDAMNGVENDMMNAIPKSLDVNTNVNGYGNANTINHTGVIRVEGVNDSGTLSGIVDIIIGELRKEVRV